MLVELVIITRGWTFNPLYNLIILQVIWAIGISMIILGLLVRFSYYVILIYGLVVVFGHNLLVNVEIENAAGQPAIWWDLVHHAKFAFPSLWKDHYVMIVYAFLPWSGLMALGYCFGSLFKSDVPQELRQKRLLYLGLAVTVLFVALRFVNQYGDPTTWAEQPRGGLYTFLSFLNTNKYPPSLMFLSMTIGLAILFLALVERVKGKLAEIFIVYGRVPFFYYVLHFYIIHSFCVIAFFASGNGVNQIVDMNSPFLFRPQTKGFNLWVVYGIWLAVVVILYPLCKWYKRYKATHNQWWLSYT